MGINKDQLGISMEITKGYISDELTPIESKVNNISIAQKTVNENLSYCISGITATLPLTPSVGAMIPFIPTINNGIVYDTNTKLYTLKTGVSYSIKSLVRLYSYSGYFYYTIYDYTNSKELGLYGCMEGATGANQALFPTTCIVKPTTDIQIGVRIVQINASSVSGMMQNTSFLTIEQTGKSITIDPVEYVNTNSGIEDALVGHVMSFMGTTAPSHYLACDGAIYNITTYPSLSQFIHDQFGSYNFFGGDGTTTFAVPDLRGEFLRGTGAATRNTGTGTGVGVHQDATEHMRVGSDGTNNYSQIIAGTGYSSTTKEDSAMGTATKYFNNSPTVQGAVTGNLKHTSRPTNTAILYCIKFEPTYFMSIQGLIEETTLWEGNIGTNTATTVSNSITLSDSFMNYDTIGVCYDCIRTDGSSRPLYREIKPSQINALISSSNPNISISFTWGFSTVIDYTDIQKTSTTTRLDLIHYQSYIKKVIGYKYKTFQS